MEIEKTAAQKIQGRKMKQANAILGLLAQTSIHAGTGQNTGIIDLPIQREGHNGHPCIASSAVKGGIRTCAEDSVGKQDPSIALVFGSEANQNNSYAGAVAFSEARLLLFPVRSLTSQFKWVTCPAVLARYQRDAKRSGQTINFPTLPTINDDVAILHAPEAEEDEQQCKPLFLEEYRFDTQKMDLTEVIKMLAELMGIDQATTLLEEQLTLISNDMFSYIVQHGTPVNAHIAIDSATKTVKNSALWYEETLPPESLLYTTLSASNAREKAATKMADDMLGVVTDLFDNKPWLQLGGNETVGMGWFSVKITKGKEQ